MVISTLPPGVRDTVLIAILGALCAKEQLRRVILQTISQREYDDVLKYLALVFVIYPLLPQGRFGPFGFLKPRKIWLFVVVISSVSFLGYFLIKFAGLKKGDLLSTSPRSKSMKAKAERPPKLSKTEEDLL